MRLRVTYHLACSRRVAAAKARDIAFEQTLELPEDAVSPEVAERVAGRVESVESLGRGRSRAVISFDPGAVCGDLPQLLNLLFGNISLKAGILIASLDWPDELLAALRGPRGVTYDTVLATRRLGGRRRGVAGGSPPPHRVVAHGSERRSLARPRAPRRLAGGAGRAGILDVQARGRRVTA